MEKRAAIDIGSNTVQLLAAEGVAERFRPSLHALRTTRLGADRQNGCLDAARIAATVNVLVEYKQLLAEAGIQAVRLVATSAVRDAENRAQLLAAVEESCGWRIRVLSGAEEARLSFLGAAAPYLAQGATQLLVLDIGGGSTELIRYHQGELNSVSANIGAVRAQSNGWNAAEIQERVQEAFAPQAADGAALALGVGGTLTTAAGWLLGCREYRRAAIDGYRLEPPALQALLARLKPLSLAERCALSPLLAERGEIIYEGLLIAQAVLQRLSLPALTVSGGGILDGCLHDWWLGNR